MVQITPMPNPEWKPGDPIVAPFEKMIPLDPSQMDGTAKYKFLIGAVVPRPIALVSTLSKDGIGNLAPFSFFNAVSSDPMALMFSVARGSTKPEKDTIRNIRETGEFVVHIVSEWFVEAMNATSAEYPHGVDEMKKVGLIPVPSTKVKPARVKESPIHMECKLLQTLEVGRGTGSATIVVGEVIMIHVAESVYSDGKVRLDQIQPVSRLAGFFYGRTTEIFEIPRPARAVTSTPRDS